MSSNSSVEEQERIAKLREQTEKFELGKRGEYVYELVSENHPEAVIVNHPEAVIVLFHGILLDKSEKDHAFWSTWTKKGTLDCWPVTMLQEYWAKKKKDFPPVRLRVLAVSYDSRAHVPEDIGTEGTDNYLLAENLIQELILSRLCRGSEELGSETARKEEPDVPVFLVGHDLGGILIKNLVLAVESRVASLADGDDKYILEDFLNKLRAVFFYATPHSGSQAIEDLAQKISKESQNQMLVLLSVLGAAMARVNREFSSCLARSGFKSYAIVPQHRTNQKGFNGTMVVEEASARYDMDNYFSVQADHFDGCKPQALWSASLTHLGDKVHEEVKKVRIYESLKGKGEGARAAPDRQQHVTRNARSHQVESQS